MLAACVDLPGDPIDDAEVPQTRASLALAEAAPDAAPAIQTNTWKDVTLVVQKCGSPVVVVTGGWHEVVHVSYDANGGLHRGYHLTFHLTGRSDDGALYRYSGVQQSQLYFANPPTTDVTELRIRMRAQGNREDLIQIFRYHLTINANGTVTSFLTAESEECGQGASGGH